MRLNAFKSKRKLTNMDAGSVNKKRSGQGLKHGKWEVCRWHWSPKRLLITSVTCFYLVMLFIKLALYPSVWTLLKKHENPSLGCCFSLNFVFCICRGEYSFKQHLTSYTSSRMKRRNLYLNRIKKKKLYHNAEKWSGTTSKECKCINDA